MFAIGSDQILDESGFPVVASKLKEKSAIVCVLFRLIFFHMVWDDSYEHAQIFSVQYHSHQDPSKCVTVYALHMDINENYRIMGTEIRRKICLRLLILVNIFHSTATIHIYNLNA